MVRKLILLFILVEIYIFSLGLCTSAWAKVDGRAVVVNVGQIPNARLPKINDLNSNIGGVVQAYRKKGLLVATDPEVRCLSVTGSPRITDAQLSGQGMSDYILAAGIVERLTSTQLYARDEGYLRIGELSRIQQNAVYRIANRHGFTNDQNKPLVAGSQLRVGIWPTWVAHLGIHNHGQTVCCRTSVGNPPTAAVVSTPPLSGSTLWYSWRYADALWGGEAVNIKAGTYALGDLLSGISSVSGYDIITDATSRNQHLAVVAENIPIKKLIWAIEAATGLQATKLSGSSRPTILIASNTLLQPNTESNLLRPVPGIGYHLLPTTAVTRELLSDLSGQSTISSGDSMIWSLSDLPLLYQNTITDAWPRAYKSWFRGTSGGVFESQGAPELQPNSVWVIWTKAIMVSVVQEKPDGSGTGIEIPLAAL